MKLAQPRHQTQQQGQRPDGFNNRGNQSGGTGYNSGGMTNQTQAQTPAFDAQAMANLYQRMMSVAAQGNFMGMGGMGAMGGAGRGMPGMMNPAMGMGMGGMGAMGGGMMGGGMMGMGGMGMGGMMGAQVCNVVHSKWLLGF